MKRPTHDKPHLPFIWRVARVLAYLLRWAARLLSLLAVALAIYFFAAFWPNWLGSLGLLAGLELALLIVALLSLLAAWWRELWAAIVGLGALGLAYLIESWFAGSWADSLAFGALAAPAGGYLVAALLLLGSRRHSTLAQPEPNCGEALPPLE